MTSKTAAAVLQELMVKHGETPEYECITQSGPQHLATFQYRCIAHGMVVLAQGRSKKEAKQEVARLMLQKLSAIGLEVPAPFGVPLVVNASQSNVNDPSQPAATPRSYVALLKELCEGYSLPAVEYELIGDTGPPHQRHFTIKAKIGLHERLATSTTKKAARQLAAEQLYTYLRENLSRLTQDFIEEDAIVRAREKAMDRYKESKEEQGWRPDLGQKISDYHLGLLTHIEEDKRALAIEALEALKNSPPDLAAETVVSAMGLSLEYTEMETESADTALVIIEIKSTSPALVLAGTSRTEAALEVLDYIKVALKPLST